MSNCKKIVARNVDSTYSLTERTYRSSITNGYTSYTSSSSSQSLSQKSSESSKVSNSFIASYKENCKVMKSHPLSLVKAQFSNVFLDSIVDRIKLSDWLSILKTISNDKSLHFISFRSKIRGHVIQEHINTEKKAQQVNKGSVLYTRFLINKISESLRDCLTYSKSFLCLQLQRIPLRGKGIEILAEGLKKTQSLQHLSLQYCDISDEGCFNISQALRNVPTLLTIDLSFCNITSIGAKHIADLIKFQEIVRFGECWKQSLRYREVDHDRIQGLRRVTLNDNPDIGDLGLQYIADVLMDDFWVRALDMQNCGITEDGATLVRKLIDINNEIGVVDLRRNPLLKSSTVANIIKILSEKIAEDKAEYVWLHLTDNNVNSTIHSRSLTNSTCSSRNYILRPNKDGIKKKPFASPSVCSETAQISINKVKKWKESSKNMLCRDNLEDNISISTSRTSNSFESLSASFEKSDEEPKELSEPTTLNNSNITSIKSDQKDSSEIDSENTKPEFTLVCGNDDIRGVFYEYVESMRNREVKSKFPYVNYYPRQYTSDSD